MSLSARFTIHAKLMFGFGAVVAIVIALSLLTSVQLNAAELDACSASVRLLTQQADLFVPQQRFLGFKSVALALRNSA